MRLIDFFDRGVTLDPSRACLIDSTGTLSFRETQEASHRIARGLVGLEVGVDAKAAVLSPNASHAFLCVLGILRLGAVWVPVNARNSTEDNCYILDNLDVQVLFLHSSFLIHIPIFQKACPKIRTYICIDGNDAVGVHSIEKWLEGPYDEIPGYGRPSQTLATIFGSGGTTGRPKGVMHSDLNWATLMANMTIAMPPKKPPVHLVVAPMTHGAGAVALCLLALGATQVIMAKFDAHEILASIQNHGVTHIFLPPTAIYMLLAEPTVRQFNYSTLEYFIYAAAPMSVEKLKDAMEVFGPVMAQTFAQAEAPMMCTYLSPAEHQVAIARFPERLSSAGKPAFMTPVQIMDDEGRILPPGQVGEIVVRGNLVMLGYYKNPSATSEVSTADGWHRTGDIGRLDEDGFLYLVDRKRDMIISGGFNIYPSEIERVIWGHPSVQDCAVIGVPDDKWGEAVKAIVELRPGMTVTEEEIIDLCREHLGSVKAPKSAEIWPNLPRTPVGKVSKLKMREKYWVGRDRKI